MPIHLNSLALLVCLFTSAAHAAETAPAPQTWTLERLMAALATVSEEKAHFTERKELAVLAQPIVLEGRLVYRAPHYLMKEVLVPQRERYEVDGDRVQIDSALHGRRTLTLEQYPSLRAFVSAYRATLAGDLAELRKYYDVKLAGTDADWRLVLTPRDAQIGKYVTRFVIQGAAQHIAGIETLEPGGDYSRMAIQRDAP